MLLEQFLPLYHVHEVHHIKIAASPEQVFQAVKAVTTAEVPLLRSLLAARSLPALLTGQERRRPDNTDANRRPLLAGMLSRGFVMLAEAPNQEIVLGTIGQFWRVAPGSVAPHIRSAEEFLAFDRPGYARAVMNFALTPQPNGAGVLVMTETRVFIPDPAARRQFACYWRVIMPGSALIRRMWLWAIKRRAEAMR